MNIEKLVNTGKIVIAMKQLMDLVNCGLKDAKDYLDTLKNK
jgi:ribosomal protein L7/L12